MSHVQVWAAGRLKTLGICTGQDVRAVDFSDDKLALVLRMLSDRWPLGTNWTVTCCGRVRCHRVGVRATGLIRLLSIGLRVLTLLEFVVRRRLAQESAELSGLYAGDPRRATARPTAKRLLEAFEGLTPTQIR